MIVQCSSGLLEEAQRQARAEERRSHLRLKMRKDQEAAGERRKEKKKKKEKKQ